MNEPAIRPWFLRPSGIMMLMFLGAVAYIFFGLPDPKKRQEQALGAQTISETEKELVLKQIILGEKRLEVFKKSARWELHVGKLNQQTTRIIRIVGESPLNPGEVRKEPRPIDLLGRFDKQDELFGKSENPFGDAWKTRLAELTWRKP